MRFANHGRAALTGLLLCSLLFPVTLFATETHIESETIMRFYERDTATEDLIVVPAYEYLQADVGALREHGLSLHLYGWGRYDLGDGDYFEDDAAGELLYGYAEYARPNSNLNLKLGRFYVFEGVANESVDGLRVSSDLTPWFTFSAYGGYPVALDSSHGRSGDSIFGGRIAHHFGSRYEIGLSYKTLDNDNEVADERVGADLVLMLPLGLSLYGFSAYNSETSGWAEHSWELRGKLAGLQLRPFYQHFKYEDYFGTRSTSNSPFGFLRDSGETLDVYGLDASWPTAGNFELGGKVKHYEYDLRNDASDFFALQATWHGSELTQIGGEVGLMDGDSAENDYLLGRAFFYADQLPNDLFLSGDLVYVDYNEPIFNEDTAFFASLGIGGYLFEKTMELKLSADYSSDPFFDDDLRGMLVAKYTFDR